MQNIGLSRFPLLDEALDGRIIVHKKTVDDRLSLTIIDVVREKNDISGTLRSSRKRREYAGCTVIVTALPRAESGTASAEDPDSMGILIGSRDCGKRLSISLKRHVDAFLSLNNGASWETTESLMFSRHYTVEMVTVLFKI